MHACSIFPLKKRTIINVFINAFSTTTISTKRVIKAFHWVLIKVSNKYCSKCVNEAHIFGLNFELPTNKAHWMRNVILATFSSLDKPEIDCCFDNFQYNVLSKISSKDNNWQIPGQPATYNLSYWHFCFFPWKLGGRWKQNTEIVNLTTLSSLVAS